MLKIDKNRSKKYKILLYDEGAQGNTQLGGGQLARLELMENLNRKIFNPIFLTSKDGELAKAARNRNINVYVKDIKGVIPRFSRYEVKTDPISLAKNLTLFFSASRRLVKFLNDHQIDLIHPNENLSRVITSLARKFIETPIVTHIDGEWNKGVIDKIMRFLYIWSFDVLIAVSKAVRKPFEKNSSFNPKIKTIYPGIDLNIFNPHVKSNARKKIGLDENQVVLTIIGKLHKVKGHSYLFEALKNILDSFNNQVKCLVVGNGPEEKQLKMLVNNLELENYITFTGFRKVQHGLLKYSKCISSHWF